MPNILIGCISTGQIKSEPPDVPNLKDKYLFWMHDLDLESRGPDSKRAKNNEKIVKALASNGFFVITEHRDAVVIPIYANKVANQVRELLDKGVPPQNITVSGYSKGALMTAAAATDLVNPDINFVLVSGCTDRYDLGYSKVKGRILSVYDKGDEGWFSCAERIDSNAPGVVFKEIAILTEKGHKGFRILKSKFMDLWQTPMFEWIK